ncbi:MAG TPA: mycothiol system anti-sigma-R factor [Acidimicrobiales bacterium]
MSDRGDDHSHDHGAMGSTGASGSGSESGPGVDTAALFGPTVDCVEAVHELYSYLDGELTEVRRQEISVHLDWCGPCGGAAQFEEDLRRVIANRCKDRVPQSLIERVAAAIDEESKQDNARS